MKYYFKALKLQRNFCDLDKAIIWYRNTRLFFVKSVWLIEQRHARSIINQSAHDDRRT